MSAKPPVDEQAELVAAEAVGGSRRASDAVEPARQPHEQGVAGGVTEGVVVALEAVEVEHEEHARARPPLGQVRLELPPVGQAAESVGLGLLPARLQHAAVLDQAQRHAHDDREQAGGREQSERRSTRAEWS
jgi:hypothetical protein